MSIPINVLGPAEIAFDMEAAYILRIYSFTL